VKNNLPASSCSEFAICKYLGDARISCCSQNTSVWYINGGLFSECKPKFYGSKCASYYCLDGQLINLLCSNGSAVTSRFLILLQDTSFSYPASQPDMLDCEILHSVLLKCYIMGSKYLNVPQLHSDVPSECCMLSVG
jgi:hypothetical protein